MLLELPAIEIPADTQKKLDIYKQLLIKWQKAVNLVSPSTLAEAEQRHFLDSIQIASLVSREAKIYDIGSGAGFPGLVLAAFGNHVELVESDAKKCQFMRNVSREANIPAVIHNSRIESVDLPSPDTVTSRALADLTNLLNFTEKWWLKNKKINLIFLKGGSIEEEICIAREKFKFEMDIYQSLTNVNGRILKLTNIQRIS